MKYSLLFVAVALVVCISAEDCPNNNVQAECTHIHCSSGYHRECVNSVCTCNPNQAVQCVSQADCINSPALADCNREIHCVDNRCRCGGYFG